MVLGLCCCTGFSLVVASGGHSWLQGVGFSSRWLLLLQSTDSRVHRPRYLWHLGSVVAVPGLQSSGSTVVAHGLSCSSGCGIFLDQGLNLCLLPWQANSLPLSHQGSPGFQCYNRVIWGLWYSIRSNSHCLWVLLLASLVYLDRLFCFDECVESFRIRQFTLILQEPKIPQKVWG